MLATNAILDAIQDLLATDTATIAPAVNALHVHLAAAPFTPAPDLTLGGLTEATFDGYAPLDAGVGPQDQFLDPVTTLRVIQLLEPAGGWHFLCTGVTGLPQTIHGYYVTDNTDATLFGCALLETPITISGSGQAIDLPWIRFNFASNSPF